MDNSNIIDMKRTFDKKLSKLVSSKSQNTQFFTTKTYTEMIEKVKSSKLKVSNKKPEDYQRLRRFDIMTIGETQKLIVPVKGDKVVKCYVHKDEIFQILHDTHLAIGHGGRNRMEKEINTRYKNITREMVVNYLNLCNNCEKKRIGTKQSLTTNTSMLSGEINSRCQVDLIDMQSQEDEQYKFILVYQDYLTNFIQLRPLKSQRAEEVAYVLLDIFTIFGAPSILQSENGREFANEIVQEVCDMWPELKIVHGMSKNSRAHQVVKNLLDSWLEDNNTKHWSQGLRFVQLMKNRAHHTAINCSPYEVMFKRKVKVGLKSCSIPEEVLINIKSEEDLEKLITEESTQNIVTSP